MALPEEPLSIVEQWKKKSSEMSSASNDSVVSLLSRSIETISVALNKKADNDRIQRALSFLEYERSLSLQFDKIKNDEVRSLVYGQIECLHFALHELTKERNQVKECGEMCTQTDQEVSDSYPVHSLPSNQMKESAKMFTQTDQESSQPSLMHPLHSNDSSHNDCDYSHEEPEVNWLEVPKEELIYEDIWGDEMAIKDEDIPYEDADTHQDGDLAEDSGDAVDYARAQSEIPALNYVGGEPNFENEDNDETMNEKDNETIEEDGEKDSSKTIEVEKKRRSSRIVSRRLKIADGESLDYSDGDSKSTKKKMKIESSKRKIKRTMSDAIKKKGRPLTKGQCRVIKCTACEYKTMSAGSFIEHLRCIHSTTLNSAGLVLRCDCGIEVRSGTSVYYTPHCEVPNFTVVRKREGPIQTFNDEKTTPNIQCIQCEAHPKTADGYVQHLYLHHNSYLRDHGIFLLCKCGARYRNSHPDSKHTEECTRRQFTLHKVVDK